MKAKKPFYGIETGLHYMPGDKVSEKDVNAWMKKNGFVDVQEKKQTKKKPTTQKKQGKPAGAK